MEQTAGMQLVEVTPPSFQEAWEMVLGQLRMEMSSSPYNAYVRQLEPLSFKEGVFRVGAVNAYTRDWVESRLRSRVRGLLEGIYQRPLTLNFTLTYGADARGNDQGEGRPAAEGRQSAEDRQAAEGKGPSESRGSAENRPTASLPSASGAGATRAPYGSPVEPPQGQPDSDNQPTAEARTTGGTPAAGSLTAAGCLTAASTSNPASSANPGEEVEGGGAGHTGGGHTGSGATSARGQSGQGKDSATTRAQTAQQAPLPALSGAAPTITGQLPPSAPPVVDLPSARPASRKKEPVPQEEGKLEVGRSRKVQLQRAYGTERARVIQPERGMFLTMYFFNQWLPLLGHSAMTTIIAARSLCYWNPMTGELRNTVETDMSELARRASVSVRTVKDVLNNELVKQYFLRYKVRRIMTPNGVRTAGILLQVRMDDPLTPEDQDAHHLTEEEHWYTLDFEDEES